MGVKDFMLKVSDLGLRVSDFAVLHSGFGGSRVGLGASGSRFEVWYLQVYDRVSVGQKGAIRVVLNTSLLCF